MSENHTYLLVSRVEDLFNLSATEYNSYLIAVKLKEYLKTNQQTLVLAIEAIVTSL